MSKVFGRYISHKKIICYAIISLTLTTKILNNSYSYS